MLAFFSLLLLLGTSVARPEPFAADTDGNASLVQERQEKAESLATAPRTFSQRPRAASEADRRAAIAQRSPYAPNLNERDGYTEAFAATIDTRPFEPAPRTKRYPPGAALNL